MGGGGIEKLNFASSIVALIFLIRLFLAAYTTTTTTTTNPTEGSSSHTCNPDHQSNGFSIH